MSLRNQLTMLDVAGVTASGEGSDFDLAVLEEFVFELRATENSGTATLDVKLQDSFDGGTTWNDWLTFTQLSATGAEVKIPARPPGGDVKVVYTITGTGNWDVRFKGSALNQR